MSDVPDAATATGRKAQAAIVTAAVAGLAADTLLRSESWGINILLFGVVLGTTLLLLQLAGRVTIPPSARWFLGLAILSLASFGWRDSDALNLLALAMSFGCLSMAAYVAQGGSWSRSGSLQYLSAVARNGIGCGLGILPLFLLDVTWSRKEQAGTRLWVSVGRGLLLALPPVVLIASLFASADPVFGSFFAFDFDTIITHVMVIGFGFWVASGYGRELLLARPVVPMLTSAPGKGRWGFTETLILMGSVNAVFAAFLAVQIGVFFGGSAFVEAHAGVSYAEYAREGFFDLVAVAAFVLPLILLADWCSSRQNQKERAIFRALSYLLLVFLFAVLLSAVQRMRIYQESYGLTELRLYTMAFMAWLTCVFAWFGWTVLRDQRERFAPGAAILALLCLLVLHLINPDRLIVRTNLERARAGRPFDAAYAAMLGGEAMPDLIQSLPTLLPDDQCQVLGRLPRRLTIVPDWRSWNLARSAAAPLIRDALSRDPARSAECEKIVTATAHHD
ncbi:MAG: DUF4173 domain-containing protein [Gemmatimonadota bacterium]